MRVTCGDTVVMKFPLAKITVLRRASDDQELPGMDVTVLDRSHRLQLKAASSGMEAWRLQLLHVFVAAALENGRAPAILYQPGTGEIIFMRGMTRCDPLEWPHKGGRRESLVQIAANMRGLRLSKAKDAEALGKFAGVMCPICFEAWNEVEPDRDIVTLPCGHAFCETCLGEATMRSSTTCPSCRRSFGPPEPRCAEARS